MRFIILCDCTGSMGSYCTSIKHSIIMMKRFLTFLYPESELVLATYEDYCDKNIFETTSVGDDEATLSAFVERCVRPGGGGDAPEAQKTAFAGLMPFLEDDNTMLLHFTDAPPHFEGDSGSNCKQEKQALGPELWPWLNLCNIYTARGIKVVTLMASGVSTCIGAPYCLLGEVAQVKGCLPAEITHSVLSVVQYHSSIQISPKDTLNEVNFQANQNLQPHQEKDINKLGLEIQPYAPKVTPEFISNRAVQISQGKNIFADDEIAVSDACTMFSSVLTKENVIHLVKVDLFGKAWRMLCKQRDNDHVLALKGQLGECVGNFNQGDKNYAEVREWIDESYNATDEIKEILQKRVKGCKVIRGDGTKVDRKDALDIIRNCSSANMHTMMTIITSLTYGEAPKDDDEDDINYVPVEGINAKQFFSIIPHLCSEGIIFSLRGSLILAGLAYLSGNVLLKDKAESFLNSSKGKWASTEFDTYPENGSVGFIFLANRLKQFLTEAECHKYTELKQIYTMKGLLNKQFELQLPWAPSINEVYDDEKILCGVCKGMCSSTIYASKGRCGHCGFRKRAKNLGKGDVEGLSIDQAKALLDKTGQDRSHLFKCRTCAVLYAVNDVDGLHVSPKCHFCRFENKPVATETCSQCCNRIATPLQTCSNGKVFVCCPCKARKGGERREGVTIPPLTRAVTTTLSEILSQNSFGENALMSAIMGYDIEVDVLKNTNVVKLSDKSPQVSDKALEAKRKNVLKGLGTSGSSLIEVLNLKFSPPRQSTADPIMNSSKLIEEIKEAFRVGDTRDMCMLCCEEVPLASLRNVCGNNGCHTRVCHQCHTILWSRAKPGNIVLESMFKCPYCTRGVTQQSLKSASRRLLHIIGKGGEVKGFLPGWIHTLCNSCYKVKQYIEQVCGDEERDNFKGMWQCEDCKSTEKKRIEEVLHKKFCPACNIPTEKLGGCDHITCSVCNNHWCYVCGALQTHDTIYQHISTHIYCFMCYEQFLTKEKLEDHMEVCIVGTA
eukprot:GHVN01020945.1.p1 GENE.GHVN01020945.1~~GHVN01020945.1.p1  ORF type:complete len:1007 (+),score=160.41 GHVN01020945.1:1088-4108(+)